MKPFVSNPLLSLAISAFIADTTLPVSAADDAGQRALAVGQKALAVGQKALAVELPPALGVGTPKDDVLKRPGLQLDPPQIVVPADAVVISREKTVTSSDKEEPFEGELSMLTDGEKDGNEGYSVIIAEGPQWVQVDLGESRLVDAVVLWHYFKNYRVVNDVIVQACEDPEFKSGVVTLFNNDVDNSSKQGVGSDAAFLGTHKGKQISGKGTKARYIRCWSNGNTDHRMNEIIEVEVWGRPAN